MAGDEDRRRILAYLEDRFGIPTEAFEPYLIFEKNRSWWLLRQSPHLRLISSFKVFAFGMKAFQRVGEFLKPTTRMIQVFGPLATRSVLPLTAGQLRGMLEGQALVLDQAPENGYLILTLEGRVLGLGLSIDGRVRLQIRKVDLQSLILLSRADR